MAPGPLRGSSLTRIATVLPPKEGFSSGAVGAIGLLVHRLAAAAGGEVVGRAVADPFTDVPFHPATPGWGLSVTARYAAGVVRILRPLAPALVEVHNRPEIAMRLARHFPRVTLFLHNDPLGMRGAHTAQERAALYRRLSAIVTVSGYLRDRLPDAPPGTIRVLPNSIDVPPTVHPDREKLILFVGRVVADKGADAFVAACAAALPRLPGWRAEMVGADRFSPDSPDTPFLERLRVQAAQAGVALSGYRPHAVAMELLGRAAIAVVPSRWAEPFGLAALEAMAHGAALICSGRGGLPEVAGDAALYADPDAPGALAEAIASLAADPARRHALAAAGRERAQRFDTASAAAALQALRQEVMMRHWDGKLLRK
jgi:UDP-glucose:(glucosyl)LPS alpha-1,2-glucosyltransferase